MISKMNLLLKIKNKLDESGCKYKVIEHDSVSTCREAASVRGTKVEQGAKALILIGDKKPLMAVLSCADKVSFRKLKKILIVKDLRMASKEEVKEITSVEIGAVPPWGSLVNIRTYVDERLIANKEIVYNAGDHCLSIMMNTNDYLELEKPVVSNFCDDGEL